jgi:hypothetical protein
MDMAIIGAGNVGRALPPRPSKPGTQIRNGWSWQNGFKLVGPMG